VENTDYTDLKWITRIALWNDYVLGYCGSFFFNRKVRKEKKTPRTQRKK
jgi:hypothetical protein